MKYAKNATVSSVVEWLKCHVCDQHDKHKWLKCHVCDQHDLDQLVINNCSLIALQASSNRCQEIKIIKDYKKRKGNIRFKLDLKVRFRKLVVGIPNLEVTILKILTGMIFSKHIKRECRFRQKVFLSL